MSALTTLLALTSLQTVGELRVDALSGLTSLAGLESITSLGGTGTLVLIRSNPQLCATDAGALEARLLALSPGATTDVTGNDGSCP